MTTFVKTLDDFRRHVHRRASHGLLLARDTASAGILRLQGFTLASDDFGGAEIDEFDDTVVVEEDVYRRPVSA